MGALRRQAAKFGGRTPDLVVEVADGANADTDIDVDGLGLKDVIVAAVNLTDGTSHEVKAVGPGTIQLGDSTAGDTLLVVFWSVGLGGTTGS